MSSRLQAKLQRYCMIVQTDALLGHDEREWQLILQSLYGSDVREIGLYIYTNAKTLFCVL